MSAFESSYPSLLQGVSQQIPRLRLPGQVQVQENMLSDPVTGVRRRPGTVNKRTVPLSGAAANRLRVFYTEIGSKAVHGVINTVTGSITLYDTDAAYTQLFTATASYLQATAADQIQLATIGEELFICNTSSVPATFGTISSLNPANRGWSYIKAGAFSKLYELVVVTNLGTVTASFTTPTGANVGDAALATPDNIATELFNDINAVAASLGISVTRSGVYLYIAPTTATSVVTSSSSGQTFIEVSGSGVVRTESQLSARLTSGANGYVMGVGDTGALRYYTYNHSNLTWLESGSFGSPQSITGMPISIRYSGGTFTIPIIAWEGRLAGDNDSNPLPAFVQNGKITGMSSYQGRLVFLSGPDVSLSASGKPRRFMRSTVVTLNDDECINIKGSAGSLGTASYTRAVPFQKDLLLFSSVHQALIPSAGTALTPRNAQIVLTGQYACDTGATPVPIGRTLLFPMPRSSAFFGVMEMMQSPYTDSQYTSTDSTVHLPKYMPGRCRGGVSSSSSNMVLFTCTGDLRAVFVHEYNWSGDEKIQQAWHKWTFPYDVAGAYFVRDRVVIVMCTSTGYAFTEMDIRAGNRAADGSLLPFLDNWVTATIANNTTTLGASAIAMDAALGSKIDIVGSTGGLAGERVGFAVSGASNDVITTVRSFPSGQVAIGV